MTYLLDTNVLSETRRRQPDARVVEWLRAVDPELLLISVLSLGELVKGIELLARRDEPAANGLRDWLEGLRRQFADRLLPVDDATAELWGRLSAARPLPVVDGLLAATALLRGMTLVTRNVRDFEGTGVSLLDPWA